MKILIVSQYFWPEQFRINEIARYLKVKNLEVDVLTGYPNYPGGKIFKSYLHRPAKYKNYQNQLKRKSPQVEIILKLQILQQV